MSSSGNRFRLRMLGVLLCAVGSLAVFVYFLSLSGVRATDGDDYRVRVIVPSAVSLSDHADVRWAGVRIGDVRAIGISGDHARLDLAIQREYAPLHRDAQVLIRGKSLAGESYVDIEPGTPKAGAVPAGGTLGPGRAPEATQLDQILSTFDARRRRAVQRVLDALGPGLGGRGDALNATIGGTADLVADTAPVAAVLAHDRRQVAGAIDDFGVVARALGNRAEDVRTLARSARVEAEALAARNPSVRATLRVIPRWLRQAQRTTARLGSFSTDATPVMRDLRLATTTLVPAVRDLGPAASETTRTVRALAGFTRATAPAAKRLRAFADTATPLVPAVEGVLRQVNPMLSYLEPYGREIATVFSGLRSATEQYDATGHFARLGYAVNQASLAGTLNPAERQALAALIKNGVLGGVGALHTNAYPKPGALTNPTPFSGSYERLQADPPYARR